ncbi:hypothetical protein CHS0354_016772 [Potamilus streckersoni]|uniref:EF-hand domain-containing protein n=1 Tax=Potamilus streckersoni TaxID=2493646 RepID=A0AAE0T396_9BIVA|nr:hypothetical protein CHS0354_016772 [Potamilus streckersoni]
MATSMVMSRAVSAAGSASGRMSNLPVIQHPMSRMGDAQDLNIRGSSSIAIRREHTVVTIRSGRAEVGNDHGAHNHMRKSVPERILQWPPGTPSDELCIVGKNEYTLGPEKSKQKKQDAVTIPKNTHEVREMIKDKLTTGYYGLRHLFRSNDPTGLGNVSREALLRILYTLCGYIPTDQYNKLLKMLNLDGRPTISFDAFVSCFKDNETVKREWVSSVAQIAMDEMNKRKHPEEMLRSFDIMTHDPYTSGPFSDAIFRAKCRSRKFDAKKIFPESCFDPNGMILPPQLREAYAQLGIFMHDIDFERLWQRYDKDGTGAIRTSFFFKLMGLDSEGRASYAVNYMTPRGSATPRGAAYKRGRQRPHSDIAHTIEKTDKLKKSLISESGDLKHVFETNPESENKEVKETQEKKEENKEEEKVEENGEEKKEKEEKAEVAVQDSKEPTDKRSDEAEKKMKQAKKSKPVIKLENIIDCLHYKFEESYNAMLTAFQLFDFMNDSYIARVDFRRVLQEFGFVISVSELENFLNRCGLRTIKGQINYREFLNKFQARSDNSITNKIAVNTDHVFHSDNATKDNLTSDELEAKLVEYFQGDFIKLVSTFRSCDKYSLGVITPHEFRTALEKRLGYPMSEKQWEQLKEDVGQDADGLVPYITFLQMFDIMPGAWNQKQEGPVQVAVITQAERPVPPQVERLKEKAQETMVPPEVSPRDAEKDKNRSLVEIKKQLDEVFRTRFHTFDKHFKQMDRKMTGRMSKWQFGALLKMCGLILTPQELDKLWATLKVAPDGMYSYSALIRHFVHFNRSQLDMEEKEAVVLEPILESPIPDKEEEDDADTTELVEEAKRVQRERKEKNVQAKQEAKQQMEMSIKQPPTTAGSVASSQGSVKSVRTKSLLVKVRTDVVNNWEGLKSVFKYIDRNGHATITIEEMKDIMDSMQFKLTDEEKTELCGRFDLQKNGRFCYLEFMKCFANREEKNAKAKPQAYSKFSHNLEHLQNRDEQLVSTTVHMVLKSMRKQLIKEHKSLRRAFKRLDMDNKGYLNVADFKRALVSCNVFFSNEDFYHLLTEFDEKLNGRVSYDEFLSTMLNP